MLVWYCSGPCTCRVIITGKYSLGFGSEIYIVLFYFSFCAGRLLLLIFLGCAGRSLGLHNSVVFFLSVDTIFFFFPQKFYGHIKHHHLCQNCSPASVRFWAVKKKSGLYLKKWHLVSYSLTHKIIMIKIMIFYVVLLFFF